MKKHYIIPIFVPHAACPHTCVFCNQNEITGQDDTVNAQMVADTIKAYRNTMPAGPGTHIEVGFFGGSFTGIPIGRQQELLAPAREAKEKGIIQGIRLSTRPDYINDAILHHLAQHQVDTVEIGVQSFSDPVLLRSERGHNAAAVHKAVQLIRQYGFRLGIQLMVGLPDDTYTGWMQSVAESVAICPDFVRIYPTLVLENTQLDAWQKAGTYNPLILEEAVLWCRDGLAQFRLHGIPVIRIGLQPTEEISPQARVTGGPYHPAFRQLVESSLRFSLILEAFKSLPDLTGQTVHIRVPREHESDYRGQKNMTLAALARLYPHQLFVLQGDINLKEPHFRIGWGNDTRNFTVDDLLASWVQGRQA